MLNSERNIFISETEIKPNRYASYVLAVTAVSVVFCWILNELGLFRVEKWTMRIGTFIPLISGLIPLLLILFNKKAPSDPRTKYRVIAVSFIITIISTTLLVFHTTMMLLYPIFVAMLYRSNRIGILALVASLLCTILSPILAYLIGTWELEYLVEMILIGTNETVEIAGNLAGYNPVAVFKILLYIVLPRLVIVGACSLLMFYVVRLGVSHVETQVELNRISHHDALTGLYNQNYFVELRETHPNGRVGVVFLDVNGLKEVNDAYGHERGDMLLQRSAKSILDVCNDDTIVGFRLGGDEFLIMIEDAGEKDIELLLKRWEEALDKVNAENRELYEGIECSMAFGYAAGYFSDIEEIVKTADSRMYKNKTDMKSIV